MDSMDYIYSIDFYGILLYAEKVLICMYFSIRWDLYVFLYFAKHTWISMDSTDFFYFMDFYGLLLHNDYGFIPYDDRA